MKSHYGWVIVAVGALISCVGFGVMFSLPVFLAPISESTQWSRAGIGTAMTLNFLVMGPAAFGWGALSDRFGPRVVVLSGSLLMVAGMLWASHATTLLEFQVAYGVLIGLAGGSLMAPMIATTMLWFDKHRALAVSLVSMGVGVAPMTMAPFAGWLIQSQDWRASQVTLALFALALMVPAALLVRKPPAATLDAAGTPDPQVKSTAGEAFRSPQFIVLALTYFACCATHSGPIFHTVSYAVLCGLPAMTAVTIYSVEGLAGLGGRLLFGVLGDRFGAKPVLVAGLLVQAFAAGAYVFASRLGEFYLVAAIFGLAYGGVMPLYAVLVRSHFAPQIMGTVLGATTMLASLGMASGPAVGGWIYDTYREYTWLYIGSFMVGLGAAAIAMTFPSARSGGPTPLTPAHA